MAVADPICEALRELRVSVDNVSAISNLESEVNEEEWVIVCAEVTRHLNRIENICVNADKNPSSDPRDWADFADERSERILNLFNESPFEDNAIYKALDSYETDVNNRLSNQLIKLKNSS